MSSGMKRDMGNVMLERPTAVEAAVGGVREYVELAKLRMGLLSALIAGAGYYMASVGGVNWSGLIHAFAGTFFLSTGAFALNQYLERELDSRMERTRTRPLPALRMQTAQALFFGMALSAAGILYLSLLCNLTAGALGAFSLGSYALIYTPMKRISNFNTLIGAVPGAMPPVIGWAAETGSINFNTGILFTILFLWQLPHFLAIAWMYREDYARAGMPMITTMDSTGRFTARQMLIYAAALLFISVLPYRVHMAGDLYLWSAAITGVGFLALCMRWAMRRDYERARHVFLASLIHIPVLYVMMAVDKV